MSQLDHKSEAWSALFSEPMSDLVKRYTASVFFDRRLWQADIEGSLAHAAMLQRQQAGAIIAARQRIVEGAVGMVEMALGMLSQKDIVTLDDERKAAMVSNLLVVLCGERGAQPIVNTGTIYQ